MSTRKYSICLILSSGRPTCTDFRGTHRFWPSITISRFHAVVCRFWKIRRFLGLADFVLFCFRRYSLTRPSVKRISLSVIVVLALPQKFFTYWQEHSLNTIMYVCLHEHVTDCMCGHIYDARVCFFFLERNHKSVYLRECVINLRSLV